MEEESTIEVFPTLADIRRSLIGREGRCFVFRRPINYALLHRKR